VKLIRTFRKPYDYVPYASALWSVSYSGLRNERHSIHRRQPVPPLPNTIYLWNAWSGGIRRTTPWFGRKEMSLVSLPQTIVFICVLVRIAADICTQAFWDILPATWNAATNLPLLVLNYSGFHLPHHITNCHGMNREQSATEVPTHNRTTAGPGNSRAENVPSLF